MNKSSGSKIVFSVISIVFFLILIITLFRLLIGRTEILTFEGFLQVLQNSPSINIANLPNLTITADWGVLFNWFRDFLNIYTGLLNILIFVCANLYNAYIFIVYGLWNLFLI